MYLAFIHIGRYDIKARRHLACVQNGITQLGDWRMETWQLALRARCHVSIRQSPSLCNAILNTCPCLLAILIPNWRPFFLSRSQCLTGNCMFAHEIGCIIFRVWQTVSGTTIAIDRRITINTIKCDWPSWPGKSVANPHPPEPFAIV